MTKFTTAVLLAMVCFNTMAYEIDTEACAGKEYIYDLDGNLVEYSSAVHTFVNEDTPVFYAGKAKIPYLSISNTRYANIRVTNISNRLVSFFYRPTYIAESSGIVENISPESLAGVFSASNTPFAGGGADMQPNTFGRITVWKTPKVYQGFAEVYWDSSVCGEEPIVVGVENVYSAGAVGISVTLVNDGKPF